MDFLKNTKNEKIEFFYLNYSLRIPQQQKKT